MGNQQGVKLFLFLTICTAYIVAFSQLGAFAYASYFAESNQYPEGTTIGQMNISGKLQADVSVFLPQIIDKWKNETKIRITYREKTTDLQSDAFKFSVDESIQSMHEGMENPLIVQIKEQKLIDALNALSPGILKSNPDIEKMIFDLESFASELVSGKLELKVEQYLPQADSTSVILSSSVIKDATLNESIKLFVKSCHEVPIPALTQVSFNQLLEEHDLVSMDATSVSKIASAVFETILKSNFVLLERHISRQLPDKMKPGYEVRISSEDHADFMFFNPNEMDYSLFFNWDGNDLIVDLKGPRFLLKYSVVVKEQVFEPKTIKKYNPLYGPAEKRIESEGMNGLLIKIIRESFDGDVLVDTETISEDFYPPIHRVEVHGIEPIPTEPNQEATENTETIPKVEVDPSNTDPEMPGDNVNSPEAENAPDSNIGNDEDIQKNKEQEDALGKEMKDQK